MNAKLKTLTTSGFLAFTAATLPLSALADNTSEQGMNEDQQNRQEQQQELNDTLTEAAATVENMRSGEDLAVNMSDVKGIFVVPNYARAAVGVGGAGGEGVLIVREGGDWNAKGWSQPMFYNVGSISAGAQVGIEAGEIAMLLVTEEAVNTFMQDNNFSLNADAGLTIVDYSERAQASAGKGDIVIWSDTEGLFADLAVNVENIFWDDEENRAYYGKQVNPDTVLMGNIDSKVKATPLQDALK